MTLASVRPALLALSALAAVLVVGVLDHVTGIEIRLFPLYFLPIAWAAWYGSARVTLLTVLASTLTWLIAARLGGRVYSSSAVWVINTISQLVAFASIGGLLVVLKQRLAHEAALSRHDPLTTLLNYRGFSERARALLRSMVGTRRAAVFAFIDLDNFKYVNDLYGHETGDRALLAVANVLRAGTRAGDLVARVGGDEFVVTLRDADQAAAEIILERLRTTLALAMREESWPITASVGALVVASPAPELDEILRLSDDLMYRAKEDGKNRVLMAEFQTLPTG